MRLLLTVGLFAVLVALWGCRQEDPVDAAGSSSTEVLFRYHFVGGKAVGQDNHGTQFKRVAGLEQTGALLRQTLERVARWPGTVLPVDWSDGQEEEAAGLLRLMLEDLLQFESFVELRGPRQQEVEWLLGVALPSERVSVWRTGLGRLTELWGLGGAESMADDGNEKALSQAGTPGMIRWAEEDGWLLVGVGGAGPGRFEEVLAGARDGRRPVGPLLDGWVEAEADLRWLAGSLGLSGRMAWPRVELRLEGRQEDLRTTMRLMFPQPVTGPLQPWRVPTNIVCEPLISFTAARGFGPLLDQWDALRSLVLEPVPDEMYVWAQENVAFQTFWAIPTDDSTNRIKRVAEVGPGLLGESWRKQGRAQITWDPARQQVLWKGLPFIVPHLGLVQDAGADFIVGGLFPPERTGKPPPAELLAQFVSRPDVVYYDWEMTQVRLNQWRHLAQLFAVIARDPQLSTNTAGLNWLMEIEPLLGNTTTEITVESPVEWLLVRRSHLGLGGMELVALVRWLESQDFPRPDLRLPAEPDRKAALAVPSTSN